MICGDFNADPLHRDGSTAYDKFVHAGFRDAWADTHRRNLTGGLTWGHDELLADPGMPFDRRIDLVFFKGLGFVPTQASVVDMGLGRTEPPLWASDHAAVDAEFMLW
jgi:endonuclease/exonuclease/phosphatase family metal-dependent hydrolase